MHKPLIIALAVALAGCQDSGRTSVDTTAIDKNSEKILVNYSRKDGAVESFNFVIMDGIWDCRPENFHKKTRVYCEKVKSHD